MSTTLRTKLIQLRHLAAASGARLSRRPALRALVAVVAISLCFSSKAHAAPSILGRIGVGTNPVGIATNANTNRIYVSNSSSQTVSVINGAWDTVVATVTLGAQPDGIAVNPSSGLVYVVLDPTDQVVVIDGVIGSPTENTIVATIGLPARTYTAARGMALNPVTNRLYVTSFDPGGAVAVVDTSTNTFLNLIGVAANPLVSAVDPATNQIYVGHGSFFGRNRITRINGATNAVSDGPVVGLSQVGLAVDSATNRIYVHKGDPSRGEPYGVVVVNGATNSVVTSFPVGAGQGSLAIDTINRRLIVDNNASLDISVVDITPGSPTEHMILRTLATGPSGQPSPAAFNAATGRTYVGLGVGTEVVVVGERTSPSIVARIGVGTNPVGIAANANTNRIYVTNSDSQTVSVINGAWDTVVATVTLGAQPDGVAVNPSTGLVYAVLDPTDQVVVIDGVIGSPTENTILATIGLPARTYSAARGMALNPVTNRLYVSSFDPGGAVAVVDTSTNTFLNLIGVAANPFVTAVDPVTNQIYVGHGSFFGRTRITRINGATNAVSDGPVVGLSQFGLAVDSATNRIYVHKGDPSRGEPYGVVVVNGATNSVVTSLLFGAGHGSLALDPFYHRLLVDNNASLDVSVVDITPGSPTENTVVLTLPTGSVGQPSPATYNAATGRTYVGLGVGTEVLAVGDIHGDCNDDGRVDSGDLSALWLELADGDGSSPANVPMGTFLGSPAGCDANRDHTVSAADLSCDVLTVFFGQGACR